MFPECLAIFFNPINDYADSYAVKFIKAALTYSIEYVNEER